MNKLILIIAGVVLVWFFFIRSSEPTIDPSEKCEPFLNESLDMTPIECLKEFAGEV